MPYVGGAAAQGMGVLDANRSPFQPALGVMRAFGAYTDAEVEVALRSFPNSAVRIEGGETIRDLVHHGQPIIGTLANVAAALARFNELNVQDRRYRPGTSVGSDPKTAEQLAVIAAWQNADRTGKVGEVIPGDYGNVNPKYAGYAIAPDGSVFADGRSAAVMTPYAESLLAANRYVLILNEDGNVVSAIGAVWPETAQAIMDTYTPGVNAPTAAQQAARTQAEAQAKVEAAAAQVANVPPASSGTQTRTVREAEDQSTNIPAANGGGESERFIPAGSGGGGYTPSGGDGPYLPPVVSGGGSGMEEAVPFDGGQPVSIAPEGELTATQKKMLVGAGMLALFFFTRKGK